DYNLIRKPGVEQGCGSVGRPSLQRDAHLGDFLWRRFPAQPDGYPTVGEKQGVSFVLIPTDFRKRFLPQTGQGQEVERLGERGLRRWRIGGEIGEPADVRQVETPVIFRRRKTNAGVVQVGQRLTQYYCHRSSRRHCHMDALRKLTFPLRSLNPRMSKQAG